MEKLVRMTDFILESDDLQGIKKYAEFLRQPLTLGMFVPCDRDGKPLEEIKWIKAKQEVLFEGFEWNGEYAYDGLNYVDEEFIERGFEIEDIIDWNLRLKDNAKNR